MIHRIDITIFEERLGFVQGAYHIPTLPKSKAD
jgi:hypothetical protein